MPGVYIENNDPIKMYKAAEKAVKRARSGEGPTLIAIDTYRYYGNDPVKIVSVWNIKLSPMLRAFSNKLQGHFEQGTEDALKRIKDYFESS